MLEIVRKTIADNRLLQNGDHVLVAVSGGPDSVALLRILEILSGEYSLKITVAHLNHGLRGKEGDREEEFVRALSNKKNLPFISEKVNIGELRGKNGGSLEETGRRERYRFLNETAELCGATKVATGHHRDDQVETFFMNLFRGSGLDGLKGIAPIRDSYLIRPLLYVNRAAIFEFLDIEGLPFMTDSSNADQSFLRNSIRNWLLPELTRRYNPRLAAGISHTTEIIRLEEDYMQDVVEKLVAFWGINPADSEIAVPLTEFYQQHQAIQARMVKFLLEGMTPSQNGIGHRHIESVLNLSHKRDSAFRTLDLPLRIVVEKGPVFLKIRKVSQYSDDVPFSREKSGRFEIKVEVPATIEVPEIKRNVMIEMIADPGFAEIRNHPEVAFMDYDCIKQPLFLRNWRPGDRIELLGLGGTKKLKKYFIDKKISSKLRGTIPLLVDSLSVIWIADERISQRVRVTENTKKVLKIELV
jgi:tRNA(Ile)-lysidine synthase